MLFSITLPETDLLHLIFPMPLSRIKIYTLLCFLWLPLSCSEQNPAAGGNDEFDEITLLATHTVDFRDPSGLTLDPSGEFLWSVSDNPGGGMYRIDPEGVILEHIEMESNDHEGIIVDPSDNSLWVVEEKLRQLVNISQTGTVLNKVQLNIDGVIENDGPEGITVNPQTGHYYVVNKKNPRQLHELNPNMEIIETTDLDFTGIYQLEELSGITFNSEENNLWIVSDSSEKVVVIDLNRRPVRAYNTGVFDGEGIAINPASRILYVVSDSDERLHIFNY